MAIAVDKSVADPKVGEVVSSVKGSDAKSAKKAKAALMGTLKSAVKSAEKAPMPKPPLKDSGDSIADLLKGIKSHDDCLMELMMAGIEVTQSKNQDVDATSQMGVKLSQVAAQVSQFESDAVTKYYEYGKPGGGMGELNLSKVGKDTQRTVDYKFAKDADGNVHLYYRCYASNAPDDLGKNAWTDAGDASQYTDKDGNLNSLPSGQNSNISGSDWDSFRKSVNVNNLDQIGTLHKASGWEDSILLPQTGGIAHAGSAHQNQMMNVLSTLQSTASEVNNSMGNVAGIPGTELQQLTQSVTTAQQSGQTANQVQQAIANQASTLASI